MSDSEMQELFVKNLKRLLNEKHCLASELAEGIGVRKSTISNWMNGLSLPRMDKINRICGFLGVDRSELFKDPKKVTDKEENKKKSEGYYLNDETAKAAQEIFENKELRALFDVQRDMDPEDLRALHNMALALKRKERGNDDDTC